MNMIQKSLNHRSANHVRKHLPADSATVAPFGV